MKSPLLILGTLLVFALFTALVVPFFVDWSQYRADIEEYGRKLTGRDVTIAGDIDIRLLPLPKLTLDGISIANHEDAEAPQLLSARRLDARLSLSPLLRGTLQVTSVTLEDPVIDLERMENGSGNWWFSPRIDLGEIAKIDEVSLQAVKLTNATFFIRDARRGGAARFDNGELTISATSLAGPIHVRGNVSFENERIDLAINSGKERPDGSMRLHVRLKPQTGMRLIYNFDGQLTGKAAGEVARGRLRIAPPAVEDAKKGDRLNVIERLPFEFSSQVKVFEESVAFEKIDFALDKKNRVTNALTGQAVLSLGHEIALRGRFDSRRLDFDNLDESLGDAVAGDLKQLISIEAVDKIVESTPTGLLASLSVETGQLLTGGDTIEDAKISLNISHERLKLETLQGILPGRANFKMSGIYLPDETSAQFIGDIGVDALDGRTLLNWFRPGVYREGKGNVGRLTMGGKLTATAEKVRINDGQFSFDGGAGTGSLEWSRAGRHAINVAIKSEKLDLTRALASDDGLAGLPDLFSKLAGEDATIGLDIAAGKIDLGDASFLSVDANAEFSPGAVHIREFSARLAEGGSFTVSGDVSGFPETVRGLLSGSITASNGALVEAMLGKFALPPALGQALKAGAVALTGEFEANAAQNRIELAGTAAGGTINLHLDSLGSLQNWEKNEITVKGSFETKNSDTLLTAFNIENFKDAGDAKLQIDAGGIFETGFEATLYGKFLGTNIDAIANLKSNDGVIAGTVNFDAEAGDGSALLRVLGIGAAPELPISARIKMFAREDILQKIQIDAEFDLGKTAGNLSGTYGTGEERGKLAGNIDLSNLDLTEFLAAVLLDIDSKTNPRSEEGWADELFKENALGAFDSELSFKAKNLRLVGNSRLSPASFILTVSKGALEISALTGKLDNGTFDGGFKLAPMPAGARDFTARFNLQNADLSRWMVSGSSNVLAKGTGGLSGTLKALGRSPAGLMSDMSGAGDWSANAVTIEGANIKALTQGLKSVGKKISVEDLIAKNLKSGQFVFGPKTGQWSASSGLLKFDPAQMETNDATTKLSVFADLSARKLDASWSVKLPDYDELPEFEISLSGPVDDLQRSYDTSALKSYLVVRGLQEGVDKLEELQAEQKRIYEEQKRLEEEEIARRKAEKERNRAAEEARLKAQEEARLAKQQAERLEAEKVAKQADEKNRLKAEEEARRQLEAELRKQDAEFKKQEKKKATQRAKAQRADTQRKAREKAALEKLKRERQQNAEKAAQKAARDAEKPLPFDNSNSAGLPVIITPQKHGVIRKVLPPNDQLGNR